MSAAERERFEERAAILEYDAGYTREEAERLAREMCEPYRNGVIRIGRNEMVKQQPKPKECR